MKSSSDTGLPSWSGRVKVGAWAPSVSLAMESSSRFVGSTVSLALGCLGGGHDQGAEHGQGGAGGLGAAGSIGGEGDGEQRRDHRASEARTLTTARSPRVTA